MKIKLTLFAILLSSIAFCQVPEGKWVNYGFSGEENLAYEFEKDNVIKLFYAGKAIPTAQPVKYQLKELGEDRYLIEMQYTNLTNNLSANVVGLMKKLGKGRMEMEFWDRASAPEQYEFTEESLVYEKEESEEE
jgi:hypothetical protein